MAAWLFMQFVAPYLRPRAFVLENIDGSVAEVALARKVVPCAGDRVSSLSLSAPESRDGRGSSFHHRECSACGWSPAFRRQNPWGRDRRLPERLAHGQRLRVEGPYGRFVFRKRARHEVWLAGGIGVAPLHAWAEALTDTDQQEIALVWVVTTRTEAFAAERSGRHRRAMPA